MVKSIDRAGGVQPLVATIHVVGQGMNVTSAPTGHFYRLEMVWEALLVIEKHSLTPAAPDVVPQASGSRAVHSCYLCQGARTNND